MTPGITKELLPTASEKITHGLIREFLMNNPLKFPYRISKEDIDLGIEEFKKICEKLPPPLDVLVFE